MIIQCSECGTRFRFDESKIPASGVRLKCSKCNNVFIIKSPDDTIADSPGGQEQGEAATSSTAAAPPAHATKPTEGAVKCPHCSRTVPMETHFCPHCREDVTHKGTTAKESPGITCHSCQTVNPHLNKVCRKCGKPLRVAAQSLPEVRPVVCSQCGAPVPGKTKFCSECGAKVTAAGQGDQPVEDDIARMQKMYAAQGLDSGGGGTIFPFTAGWDDEFSGDPAKPGGEASKRILTLQVIAGPGEGKEYTLTKKRTIIGRSDADIIIDDFKISRHHAEIEIIGPKFLLKDLESTNGTFLNRSLTPADFLNQGDQIQIGDTLYRVFIRERHDPG